MLRSPGHARIILLLVGCSLAFCVALVLRSPQPRVALEGWPTDHISHISMAIVFGHKGFAVFDTPANQLLVPARGADAEAVAAEVQWPMKEMWALDAKPGALPLPVNWSHLVRPYPPGVYLFQAPAALARVVLGASMRTAALISVVQCVLIAHLVLLLLASMLFGAVADGKLAKSNDGDARSALLALGLALWCVAGAHLLFWSLNGFYDGIAILFLLLCARAFARDKPADTVVFFALAVFFHYRALWFVALPVLAVTKAIVRQPRERLAKQDALKLALSLPLLTSSAYGFWLALPHLTEGWPENNPFLLHHVLEIPAGLLVLGCLLAAPIALLLKRRFQLGAILLTVLAFLLHTPQIWHWHALFLIPLLVLPARTQRVSDGLYVLGFFLMCQISFFEGSQISAEFVQRLWTML